MQELVKRIGDDERRHMAWGTFTCRRHVAADDAMFGVVEERINELLEPALEMVRYPLEQFDVPPFGLEVDDIVNYAFQRGTRRLGTIESARGKDLSEIEGDYEPIHLEDRFADEDAAEYAEAS
jgi:ribonucleoside-diphosphate reductase beta chain